MDRREALEKRNAIAGRLRGILDTATAEQKAGKRESDALTGEERANYDQMHTDMVSLEEVVRSIDATSQLRTQLDEREQKNRELSQRTPVAQQTPVGGDRPAGKRGGRLPEIFGSDEYKEEFRFWLRTGHRGEHMVRALQATADAAGGFTILPEELETEVLKQVTDEVIVRQLASVKEIQAASLGIPTLAHRMAAATWGTELQVAAADATMDFGKRRLTPHPMTAQILVSKLLALQSFDDIDQEVTGEFARIRGELEETGFLKGNGAGQPLGLFTGDINGISTGRDVVTGSSSGSVTADNFIRTLGFLKPQYRKNATWLLHRDKMWGVRLLKDTNNNYIWLPAGFGSAQAMVGGLPTDTILGRPYFESEFAPNSTASTTGTGVNSSGYNAIVGDFKRGYRIVDGPGLGVNRYDQINAVTNQDTYIGLFMVDGAPVLEEAFARSRSTT